MTAVERVVAVENRLGESPVWCERQGRLYWVDSRAPSVSWFEAATGGIHHTPVADLIGSIALRRSGGLIAAMRKGIHRLDAESGALELIVDPEPDQPENRF